jgi:hypothetical protein
MNLISSFCQNFIFIRHGFIAEEYRKVFYGQLDNPLIYGINLDIKDFGILLKSAYW